ncbi:MAG: hypothetical protein ABGY95_09780 [Rubritalea sp.]|uniref:hypothetical protein n=1 Tax=Rubritalea sp. TaxID=2109375 RepID=UPI003242FEC9
MSEKQKIKIKVPEYGELRESVVERLRRVRLAFSDANTHESKHEAIAKILAKPQTI